MDGAAEIAAIVAGFRETLVIAWVVRLMLLREMRNDEGCRRAAGPSAFYLSVDIHF
jgi:hypothetical protein